MIFNDIVFTLEIKENGYYAFSEGRYYKVNKNTFNILRSFKDGKPVDQIAADYSIDKSEIEKILSVLAKKQPNNGKITKMFVLIPAVVNNFIGRLFQFFGKTGLLAVIAVLFVLSVSFHLFNGGFKLLYDNLGLIDYLVILCVVIMIHEYGHIAMAYKRGLKNLNIYAGFYMIFPIFYSKMDELVTFNFRNRLLVNFGGIYFQMIAVVISYACYFYYGHEMIQLFITINLAIILINIIPFSFTDGYWLYSDLVKVDNLNNKATKLISNAIRMNFNEKQPFSIVLYAIFRTFVSFGLMVYVIYFLFERSQYLEDTFYQLKESNWNIIAIFRSIFLLFPFILFILYLVKKIRYGLALYTGRNSQ
ncbi:MAG: hypothetical protein LBS69_04425 [Prevotellaceae bacterium]|nr:hypothetical protein [Prevotellaceae bacterium]